MELTRFEIELIALISQFYPFGYKRVFDCYKLSGKSIDKTLFALEQSQKLGTTPENIISNFTIKSF